MERLTKAGIYIAEHLTTHEQFIVNVIGTAPLLKITNIVNLNEFSENVVIDNEILNQLKRKINPRPDYIYLINLMLLLMQLFVMKQLIIKFIIL